MQLDRFAHRALLTGIALSACALVSCAAQASAASANSTQTPGSVLFYDNFDQGALDTVHWVAGRHQWGGATNNGVIPQNLSLTTITDPATGQPVSVLDAQAHGDRYTGAAPGIRKVLEGFEEGGSAAYASPGSYGNGYVRTGGVVWTRLRYGPARYQIRMRTLQERGGETGIWNYYDPVYDAPGSGTYTEIDIEIPANGSNGNMAVAGLNSYATAAGTDPMADSMSCDCVPTGVPNQADGKFHLYEIDWYDGSDGSQPRIQWYFDGVLERTTTTDVPVDPAQLWVGNWPARWSYKGAWNYSIQDEYIDYVKISKLPGDSYPSSPLPPPAHLTVAASSDTTVDLVWEEAADSRTIAGYNVLANGVLIEQTPDTHIELTGLTPGERYSFAVEAVNSAIVASSPSNAVSATLPATPTVCRAAPTRPVTGLTAIASAHGLNGVTLRWAPPAAGRDPRRSGCPIIGYEITRSNSGTTVQPGDETASYLDKAAGAGEQRYEVTPYNEFGAGPGAFVNVMVHAAEQR